MLDTLQQHLAQIYELDTELSVLDFLITDPLLATKYDKSPNARTIDEKLLVCQNDETLDIALYINRDVLHQLEQDNPFDSLNDNNIHQFWIALEGVSHFNYLVWNARFDRPVSLFELELQAEVDKFVLTIMLLNQQENIFLTRHVLQHLFLQSSYDEQLNRAELWRYIRANYFACHYCEGITALFSQTHKVNQLHNELRRFYRLTQHYKLRHIYSVSQRFRPLSFAR
ncbi:MAG: hypothetical protein OEZ33_07860 [Gammaproteobacteria bacterium]|nr:hypothetical protein [Gammaproteobacteria bacterium]MDH5778110.1 hypothetical protein [Gammaproteobacteria bacterium]